MTFAQKAHLDGVVIGSTPKDGALLWTDEGSNMFRQLGRPVALLGRGAPLKPVATPWFKQTNALQTLLAPAKSLARPGAAARTSQRWRSSVVLLKDLPFALNTEDLLRGALEETLAGAPAPASLALKSRSSGRFNGRAQLVFADEAAAARATPARRLPPTARSTCCRTLASPSSQLGGVAVFGRYTIRSHAQMTLISMRTMSLFMMVCTCLLILCCILFQEYWCKFSEAQNDVILRVSARRRNKIL